LVDPGEVFLQSRTGKPLHSYFPDVVGHLAQLPPGTVVDGELVVWDAAAGRTSFIALQRRIAAGRGVADLADAWPAHMICFDMLQERGTILLDEPLARRRTRLEAVLTDAPWTPALSADDGPRRGPGLDRRAARDRRRGHLVARVCC
jgi:ATP-dependent DNA ligase